MIIKGVIKERQVTSGDTESRGTRSEVAEMATWSEKGPGRKVEGREWPATRLLHDIPPLRSSAGASAQMGRAIPCGRNPLTSDRAAAFPRFGYRRERVSR